MSCNNWYIAVFEAPNIHVILLVFKSQLLVKACFVVKK